MNKARIKPPRSLEFQTLGVFVLVSLIYWAMRSKGLDDMDSVQFAMGVGNFNLFGHSPHPPGYPLYIFAGWVLTSCTNLDPPKALTLVSCLGGGLFTAAWFFMFARRFGRAFGCMMAAALTLAPMQWMTATKVLTDAPASAFLAIELAFVGLYLEKRAQTWIFFAAVAGAIGAGIRPQNIGVLLIILIMGLIWARAGRRHWTAALAVFLAANLLWFVLMLWTQSRLPAAHGSWMAYPNQLVSQWRWRLDKPGVYVGAGELSIGYIADRVRINLFDTWFANGFGWSPSQPLGAVGIVLFLAGAGLYLVRGVFRRSEHASFWRFHLCWAVAYTLMIFCCLPAAMRYHLPILPLLLLPAVAGWWSLGGRWRWTAAALPIMLLFPSIPLIAQNHNDLAPPIKAVRYLNKKHPNKDRDKVVLFLVSAGRHAQWYGKGFKNLPEEIAAKTGDELLSRTVAVYTDDRNFLEKTGWKNARLERIKNFKRSPVIHHKHARITLYRVVGSDGSSTPSLSRNAR